MDQNHSQGRGARHAGLFGPCAWDIWERAGFAEEEAREKAHSAKEEYENALREADYGI